MGFSKCPIAYQCLKFMGYDNTVEGLIRFVICQAKSPNLIKPKLLRFGPLKAIVKGGL